MVDFDGAYAGTPPWEVGHPQPVFVALADSGELTGRVLDVGCGTGEHVLLAAERGLDATGVDSAPTAIGRAAEKARERDLAARFVVLDALRVETLGERFDTVLDSGFFHVLDDADRVTFLAALAQVLVAGGRYLMLCFSDRQPGDFGPRRLSEMEIRGCFADGWRVDSIEPADFNTTFGGAAAWLVRVTRI